MLEAKVLCLNSEVFQGRGLISAPFFKSMCAKCVWKRFASLFPYNFMGYTAADLTGQLLGDKVFDKERKPPACAVVQEPNPNLVSRLEDFCEKPKSSQQVFYPDLLVSLFFFP